MNAVPTARLDRSALRVVKAASHLESHDNAWREYWLSQPIEARVAELESLRTQLHGPLPRLRRVLRQPPR